jgi:hypothetical protein
MLFPAAFRSGIRDEPSEFVGAPKDLKLELLPRHTKKLK